MRGIRLLVVVLAMSSLSCELLKHTSAHGKRANKDPDAKPASLAEIDTSDLPEQYVPNIRPVIVYYVDNPTNSQFTFGDEIGDYRVMLYPDHRYRFLATAKDKSSSQSREGLWKWHRIGPDQGVLMLDNRRWLLNFTSLEEATATTTGDGRSYVLKFSHM